MEKIETAEGRTVVFDDTHFLTGDLCKLYPCTIAGPAVVASDAGSTSEPGRKGSTWYDKILEDDDDLDKAIEPLVSKPSEMLGANGLLKVAANSADDDLVRSEGSILRDIFPIFAKEEKFQRYIPRLWESFQYQGREANLFARLDGYVTIEDILRVYPRGIDYQDAAWMFKRILAGIGFVHTQSIYHGAILPPHILVHPMGHGAKIVDWCYSVRMRDRRSIPAYVPAWKAYYAPEIFAKRFPTTATDTFMAAKCMVALLGGDVETNQFPADVPKPIQDILSQCLTEKPSDRPQDAWKMHEVFDTILGTLVGKPKYRPFAMPLIGP